MDAELTVVAIQACISFFAFARELDIAELGACTAVQTGIR